MEEEEEFEEDEFDRYNEEWNYYFDLGFHKEDF